MGLYHRGTKAEKRSWEISFRTCTWLVCYESQQMLQCISIRMQILSTLFPYQTTQCSGLLEYSAHICYRSRYYTNFYREILADVPQALGSLSLGFFCLFVLGLMIIYEQSLILDTYLQKILTDTFRFLT